MKKELISLFSLAALFLSACSSVEAPTPDPDPGTEPNPETTPGEYVNIPMSERQKEIVTIGNDFAFDFFKNHSAEFDGSNTSVSPFSLFTVLSMLTNGADGELQEDIIKTLYGDSNTEATVSDLNDYASHLLTALPEVDRTTTLRLANSVWGEKEVGFLPSFLEITGSTYKAERVEKSPAGNQGMEDINAWVSDKTNGFISKFLKEPFDGKISLINAVYFYGIWKNPFKTEDTKSQTFYGSDGSKKSVPFMNQKSMIPYYSDVDLQYVSMPYGNGNFVMEIILPQKGKSLKEIYSGLSASKFRSIGRSVIESKIIELGLPRFETYLTKDILPVLNRMGLKISGKNFTEMTEGNAMVDKIIQGVKIRVDEKGTEAAGATGSNQYTDSGNSNPDIIKMTCDRPFMYVIRETSTGVILFMGKVEKL